MAHLPARPALLLALAVTLVTAAGCGDQGAPAGDGPSTAAASPSAGSSSGASDEPSPEPSAEVSVTASDEPSATATATRPPGLRSALLTAAQVPPLNTGFSWRTTNTSAEGDEPFGVCQKTPLVSIGATSAQVRTHAAATAGSNDTASQVVARFADAKSAWRTYEVLKSWRSQCADFMRFDDERVSDLTEVPVGAGVGHRFLVSYLAANGTDAQIVAYGMTRVGRHISLVQFDVLGQDWNYARGKEPASLAVAQINRLLAALR
ncbi:hypothetical protein [Nocardioides sp.]|uniref:hypothetical protein n=1 Tax=Nocardioides sp. TaxID=35761 RepID=UPI003D102BDA